MRKRKLSKLTTYKYRNKRWLKRFFFPCQISRERNKGWKESSLFVPLQRPWTRQPCSTSSVHGQQQHGSFEEQQSETSTEQSHGRAAQVAELASPQHSAQCPSQICSSYGQEGVFFLQHSAMQRCKLMVDLTLKSIWFHESFESILALQIRCKKEGVGGERVLVLTLKMITKKKIK